MTDIIKPEVHLSTSLLQNAEFEPLEIILKPYQGLHNIPNEVGGPDEAGLVFITLQKCFQKAGFVAEGMIANIIWGFKECGYDERAVAAGLTKLRTLGYIKYTDKAKMPIHEFAFNPDTPVWIRYTDKFTKLLVGYRK